MKLVIKSGSSLKTMGRRFRGYHSFHNKIKVVKSAIPNQRPMASVIEDDDAVGFMLRAVRCLKA